MFKSIFLLLITFPTVAFADYYNDITKDKAKAVKEIERKYNISCYGSGGGCMYGVSFVALSFEIKHLLSIEEARKMLVDSMEIVRQIINSDKNVRPYLEEYPFPPERIELTFTIRHSQAKELSFFKVSRSSDGNAAITYSRLDEKSQLKPFLEEKYSKAKEQIDEAK